MESPYTLFFAYNIIPHPIATWELGHPSVPNQAIILHNTVDFRGHGGGSGVVVASWWWCCWWRGVGGAGVVVLVVLAW